MESRSSGGDHPMGWLDHHIVAESSSFDDLASSAPALASSQTKGELDDAKSQRQASFSAALDRFLVWQLYPLND